MRRVKRSSMMLSWNSSRVWWEGAGGKQRRNGGGYLCFESLTGLFAPGLPATVVSPQVANAPPWALHTILAVLDWSVLINTVCLRSKSTASSCTLPNREVPRCDFPVAHTQIDYACEGLRGSHCTSSHACRSRPLRQSPMLE